MKKQWKRIGALGLSISLLASTTAFAAHPAGYWPYLSAFQQAKAAGNHSKMVTTGDALLNYYKNLPIDKDVASVRYNVNNANYPIYEAKGDYAKAKAALKAVADNGAYLGFNDAVTMANERQAKIDPKASVYVLANNKTAPFYNAKYEPKNGTWYGRVYTEPQEQTIKNEAIVSFYVELGKEVAGSYAQKIGMYDDSKHAIHIALNFPNEGQTVSEINAGTHDANIQETLQYLSTLKSPVLLRIGAEMDVWTKSTTPDAYKAAYTRIANMARKTAPNVALVFSPNYTSSFGGNAEQYFPNPALVDWIGTSLYMNRYQFANQPQTGKDSNEMYFGIGNYADPVKNMAHTATLAQKYKKPIIVTEGGSGHTVNGSTDLSAFAASRVRELYTSLNMVYPQVKAIIYFDKDMKGYRYGLTSNQSVANAYQSALKANPTLISQVGQSAPTFVPLQSASAQKGTLTLRTYCDVIGQNVTVTYSLDGKWLTTQKTAPYHCQLDTASLSVGTHTLRVVCNAPNGYNQTLTYTLTKTADGTVSCK